LARAMPVGIVLGTDVRFAIQVGRHGFDRSFGAKSAARFDLLLMVSKIDSRRIASRSPSMRAWATSNLLLLALCRGIVELWV
jgi:hypothetical protein